MTNFSDTRQTARGFAALRERYIRRAEFVCTNSELREVIAQARSAWETTYPTYPLGRTLHTLPFVFPWTQPNNDAGKHPAPVERGLIDWHFSAAENTWHFTLRRLEIKFFPPEDFYATSLPHRRPAMGFIRAIMQHDARTLLGDLEQYFPLDRLELTMDLSEYDQYGIEPEEWELDNPSQSWSIPVYPGMTAKDLQDAIPHIIPQVQRYLGPRTVGARIDALRNDGVTQQAIADRLGLDIKNVQAHLRAKRSPR